VNPWIELDGYAGSLGAMAGITLLVYALWIPLFYWGRKEASACYNGLEGYEPGELG